MAAPACMGARSAVLAATIFMARMAGAGMTLPSTNGMKSSRPCSCHS